ncbi:hypothetical protein EMA8858_02021 [Emticicia aquatica]|jgi:hypothetical protein|uniref:Uncharacterized protein n=1 Tax=Emticicia aquatica TaxID=1681835 RepID=A0ABN8ETK1_9BACT|nr:hypothetical protein [Emticicia aquatica]CAH0995893.1 hypothetical protein EMA8858_02021 [Emticicia aquatica]
MNEHLENLKEIRSLMERSSKFLSLSGLSGISAGVCALLGAWYAHQKIHIDALYLLFDPVVRQEIVPLLLIDAAFVLIGALLSGAFFTIRKARKQGLNVWNSTSKRLLNSMLVPLFAGGIFCLGLIYNGFFWIAFPATLVFYGIALVNASKYTVRDTYYLGMGEIVLGIISLFLARWNLIFWAAGFGVLHIVYGVVMYFKYDKITA